MTVRGVPCITYATEYLYHNENPAGFGGPGGIVQFVHMMTYSDITGKDVHAHQPPGETAPGPACPGRGEYIPRYISQDFYAFERKLGDNVVLVAINNR